MTFYTKSHAARLVSRAGEPWRPANGFEGDLFLERVCRSCAHNGDDAPGCSIYGAMLWTDIGDPDYPPEMVIGPDGQPRCTAFTANKTEE